ncbi:hypothetical protein BRM9_1681 [Methanobacterium formicicum]|uniref:Uncharacterized protein n=1 Tax=Methanobacterium formicicum TaxID=2162 RepID=A0A089ZEN5_METFO|nr:hypothetical protein [Methanobacterium formicicum]AIS32492.1 hypothetical protein BRM9_1681 [Methanobacterium formicicum]
MSDEVISKDEKPAGWEGKEKIFDKKLTSQNSITISPLNGNRDEIYKLRIMGAAALTATPTIESNLSNNWQGDGYYFKDDAGYFIVDGDLSGKPKLGEGFTGGSAVNQLNIKAEFVLMKNIERSFRSDCSFRTPSYKGRSTLSAHHTGDYTTSLNYITINFGGPFTGRVILQRVSLD